MDMVALVSKSIAADINSINRNIVDRLFPHYVAWSKQYGTTTLFLLISTSLALMLKACKLLSMLMGLD